MDITKALQSERQGLMARVRALDAAIMALNGRPARRVPMMSAAKRAEVSRKMKAIWKARKAKSKG